MWSKVAGHFSKKCVRAYDRGYDANIYYEHLIRNNEKFIIRTKKNRDVVYQGEKVNILDLASRDKGKYNLAFRNKSRVQVDCKVSLVPIGLPCKPNVKLNLVVCNGLGKSR